MSFRAPERPELPMQAPRYTGLAGLLETIGAYGRKHPTLKELHWFCEPITDIASSVIVAGDNHDAEFRSTMYGASVVIRYRVARNEAVITITDFDCNHAEPLVWVFDAEDITEL